MNEEERAKQLFLWREETFEERIRFGLRAAPTRFRKQTEYQEIEIMTTELGGTLLLDGAYMTAAAVEHYYHEMLVHPAMTTTPFIERVLVIGGGDGGTVREVLRYPEVKSVTLCELDPEVVWACRDYLTEMEVPWDDPRLTLAFGDGAAFVADDSNGEYDVILVDGADPVGPAAVLFSDGFYKNCKKRLKPSGTLASQTESPIVMRETFLEILGTLRQTFGRVQPCFAPMPIYPGGTWSWTLATDRQPWNLREAYIERRMQIAEATSKYYNRDIHRAAFALPNDLRREVNG